MELHSTYENKEVVKKHMEYWDAIDNEIKTINNGKEGEYGKDFMKIKFNTNDDLPAVVVRSVFCFWRGW